VHSWALDIVRHRAIDCLRRNRRHDRWREGFDGVAEGHAAPGGVEDDPADRDEARRLRAVLAHLPMAQREVIALAYFGELTHSEIAHELSLPLGTVKGRMRLGLEAAPSDHRLTGLQAAVQAATPRRAGLPPVDALATTERAARGACRSGRRRAAAPRLARSPAAAGRRPAIGQTAAAAALRLARPPATPDRRRAIGQTAPRLVSHRARASMAGQQHPRLNPGSDSPEQQQDEQDDRDHPDDAADNGDLQQHQHDRDKNQQTDQTSSHHILLFVWN